ncbi:hypothetical protein [Ottowia oryzae]
MNRAERRALARTGQTPLQRTVDGIIRRARHADKALATITIHQQATSAQTTGLMLELYAHFDALKSGNATRDHFECLSMSLNTAMVLSEPIGQEVEDVMLAAHAAMNECAELHRRHRHYGFTGPGMQAVAEALEVYAQIVALSTPRQMMAAVEEGHRRVKRAIASGATPV